MMLRWLLKPLRSVKFTAWLISALGLLFLAGVVIPQKGLLGAKGFLEWEQRSPRLVGLLDFLGLTDLYTSPITLALWGIFFLNLAVFMGDRIPAILRRCRECSLPKETDALEGQTGAFSVTDRSLEGVAASLRRHGFAVRTEGNALAATRNRYAPLGTLFFHLSFFLLLLGAVTAFYTRFRGEVDLAEGETFTGKYSRILVRPRLGEIPVAPFTLERVEPKYFRRNVPVQMDAMVLAGGKKLPIGINRPFRQGSLSFIINDVDVAPVFFVYDAAGREVSNIVPKLKFLGGKEAVFPLQGYTVHARLLTDHLAETGGIAAGTDSLPQVLKQLLSEERLQDRELVNPAFRVGIYDNRNIEVAAGLLRPGEGIALGPNRLVFEDQLYWVHFYAGAERGLYIIYAAFIIMTLALLARFVFYRREVKGLEFDGKIILHGRAEFYPTLFRKELLRIVSQS